MVLCKPRPSGLDDSKKLTGKRRAALETTIKRRCRWAVGVVEVDEIDRLNIFGATMLAMTRAVSALCAGLDEEPHEVLIDGNLTPAGRTADWRWQARAIVGGDAIEPCISAASIIAKEHRDRLMRELALAHPHYGWERNAGYGTAQHLEALRRHGPTRITAAALRRSRSWRWLYDGIDDVTGFTDADVPGQAGKCFLVTGANTGLGFETTRVLAARGARCCSPAAARRGRGTQWNASAWNCPAPTSLSCRWIRPTCSACASVPSKSHVTSRASMCW